MHLRPAGDRERRRFPPRPARSTTIAAVTSTDSFLARAVADARLAAERRAERLPLPAVRAAAAAAPPPRSLRHAARRGPEGPRVIAEIKRRSPSRGDLRLDLDPAALAGAYADGGAAAVSVLTEPRHFAGSPEDLLAVRGAVDLPVLRKDFVTNPYQVWESRAWGADAVLLIVAALEDAALRDLLHAAKGAGLATLVEVHTANELDRALRLGAPVIGVNNRDLQTLTTSLEPSLTLLPQIPPGPLAVSESGLASGADVATVVAAGAHAVLVGETLLRAGDVAAKVRELSLR